MGPLAPGAQPGNNTGNCSRPRRRIGERSIAAPKVLRDPMLTDADCRNASCPSELKRRRLTDGGGLYLEVSPAGSKRWFWKFYPDGKESRLALGSYPSVTLKAARAARDEAR